MNSDKEELTEIISVRFSEETARKIGRLAEAANLSKSEFIRQRMLSELGEDVLSDRVNLLEEAVLLLLEDNAPSEQTDLIQTSYPYYINELRESERT